jgi:hypothetical protein
VGRSRRHGQWLLVHHRGWRSRRRNKGSRLHARARDIINFWGRFLECRPGGFVELRRWLFELWTLGRRAVFKSRRSDDRLFSAIKLLTLLYGSIRHFWFSIEALRL